jgi:hypothetical protein
MMDQFLRKEETFKDKDKDHRKLPTISFSLKYILKIKSKLKREKDKEEITKLRK